MLKQLNGKESWKMICVKRQSFMLVKDHLELQSFVSKDGNIMIILVTRYSFIHFQSFINSSSFGGLGLYTVNP